MEKEVTEFAKIESKLDSLPNVFAQYYYTLRAEKKSYRTIGEYLNSIKHFMDFVTNGETDEGFYKKVSATDINRYMLSLETKVVNGKTQPTSSGFKAGRWKGNPAQGQHWKVSLRATQTPTGHTEFGAPRGCYWV